MAKPKYDGVVQAVRYDDQGQVLWVRAFLRRGQVWSDQIILKRGALIEQIKSGKRIVAGERTRFLGATFETTDPVTVVKVNSHEVLVTGDTQSKTDSLTGVPLI
ncbi:MAG: hypothetical protein ABUK20_06235 [Anaerolineales bacterium]